MTPINTTPHHSALSEVAKTLVRRCQGPKLETDYAKKSKERYVRDRNAKGGGEESGRKICIVVKSRPYNDDVS